MVQPEMTAMRPRRLARACVAAAAFLFAPSCREPHATGIRLPDTPARSLGTTLLVCPSNQEQSTVSVIGVLGWIVSLGNTKINIPAGALLEPTLIQVKVPASQYMEVDVTANGLLSFLFNRPVSVTIDYSRCPASATDGATLTVWHIDSSTKELLENMGGTNNEAARTITFS